MLITPILAMSLATWASASLPPEHVVRASAMAPARLAPEPTLGSTGALSDGATSSGGREFFVSPEGSDANSGLAKDSPYKTIQKAADQTEPGDTVSLLDGTFPAAPGTRDDLFVSRSGAADKWITYRAYPGSKPVLTAGNGWSAVNVKGASYIKIEGLTIKGGADAISYDDAYANRGGSEPKYNAAGISFDKSGDGTRPTHITISGNDVSSMPGCGICGWYADYVTIEDNVVYSNSFWTRNATSGISVGHFWNSDTNTGYHNYVRRNITHDNQTKIPWADTGKISDGNGIIIDDGVANSDGPNPEAVDYVGRTLVENNVSYRNGGSGIHAFATAHVDIVNNTVYHNSVSSGLDYGSLFAGASKDIKLMNNIVQASPGEKTNDDFNNADIFYEANIYYGGLAPKVTGPKDLVADPELSDPEAGNMEPKASSPAVDSATGSVASSEDIRRAKPAAGSARDRGAYEVGGVPSSG